MNLLLITPYLEQKKGPFIWAKNFLENYSQSEKNIYTLTFDESLDSIKNKNISIHKGFKAETKILDYPFLSLTSSIIKNERENKIDIVQTNDTLIAFCALLAKRITGIPVVLRMGGEYFTEIDQWGDKISNIGGIQINLLSKIFIFFFKHIGKYSMKRVDKLVSVNSYMHDYLLKFGFESVIIPNAIDIKKYSNLADVKQYDIDILTICNLAIHKKVEGLMLLFDSIDLLKSTYPNIKLKIAGDGPYKESLIKLIESRGLDQNIEILGYRDDIPCLLNSSKLYVHSSLQDVFPNSVLEAMAAKKPVICIDIGGISEILTDGYDGILCDPDSNILKENILTIFKNQHIGKSLGCNAFKTVKERFTWESVVKKYMQTYSEIVSCSAN